MTPSPWRLTLPQLLAFAAVGLPMAVASLPFTLFLPNYYTAQMGLGLSLVGGLLLAGRVLDVVTDPLMGMLSDRVALLGTHRKSWFYLAMPVTAFSLWQVFQPPAGVGPLYLLGWSVLFYLGWTMMQIPYQSWGAELSPDYHERSRIRGAMEVFTVGGTVLAAGMPLLAPGDTGRALALLALVLVIAFPVLSTAAVALVPEPRLIKRHADLSMRKTFLLCLRNRPFRRLLAAYFINGTGDALSAVTVVFFIENVLKLKGDVGIFLSALFLAAGLAAFAWVRISYRFGKHRTWAWSLAWGSLCFAGIPFLGEGDFWPYLLLCIGGGIGFSADAIFPNAMLADVVDYDTARTGNQKTAVYFSIWGVATKLALAAPVGFALPLLDLAGFQPGGESSEQGLLAVSLLYGAGPILFKLAAMGLIWNFDIDHARQLALRRRIRTADVIDPPVH
ncbi:MFS transporter [Endothiovibrio diazotrophicus]